MELGTAKEVKGEIVRGTLPLIDHPTGGNTDLAIIIASGKLDGPTFLITANVHGNEPAGIVIIHRLIEQIDLHELKGRLVCIPSLNPTGTLLGTRLSSFDKTDPNRSWPNAAHEEIPLDPDDYLAEIVALEDRSSPIVEEFERIHSLISQINPDFHIDLHTCSTLSIPYSFLDRVFYREDKVEAEELFQKTKDMVYATGLTVIADASPKRLLKYNLQRTTSGVSLHKLRIPATTFELGPKFDVDPICRDVAIKALRNIMRWANMLNSEYEQINETPVLNFDEIHREMNYPIAPLTGVYDYLKNPGDLIKKGDKLAVIRNIGGERIGEIISELDGFVMAYWPGITKYAGEPLGLVATPDRMEFVTPWPSN